MKRSQLAKLTRPRLHKAVARERLFAKLDDAREHKPAICVVGPPGAGKTTLVASWLDARGIKGIWYQVDPGDADLATFFYYLGQAAQPFTRKGQRPLPLLTSEYLHDVEGFSRRFFREMFARLPEGATLVLDNYQEVGLHQTFHQIVVEAVGEVPTSMALVAVSRQDPPECYSRLVANDRVSRLDWEDLRLSEREAAEIAARRLSLNDLTFQQLFRASGGWVAGLVLALEEGRHNSGSAQLEQITREAVFVYFATQVFDRLSEDTRCFLTRTAWLPQIRLSVAVALTGAQNAPEILDDLYRRHLFTDRRPAAEDVYQYHDLFREFLQSRAKRQLSEPELSELRNQCAELLRRDGDLDAAIRLFCETAKWDNAVKAILDRAPELVSTGRWKILADQVSWIPAHRRSDSPWLSYWLGRGNLAMSPAAARQEYLVALEGFRRLSHPIGEASTIAGILETYWLEWTSLKELDPWIDELLLLMDRGVIFVDAETEMRVYVALMMSTSFRRPHSPVVNLAKERVMKLIASCPDRQLMLTSAATLLGHSLSALDVRLGQWVVGVADKLASNPGTPPIARLMWMRRLACHLAHKGNYREALWMLTEAEDLANAENINVGLILLCWWGGFIGVIADDIALAESYAQRLEASSQLENALKKGVLHNLLCLIALANRNIAEALIHGRAAARIAVSEGVAWTLPCFIVPAIHAMLCAGEYQEAQRHCNALRKFIKDTFLEVFVVELDLADSYIVMKSGNPGVVESMMRTALEKAVANDYVFVWRNAATPVIEVIADAFGRGIEVEFLRQKIRSLGLRPPDPENEVWPWPIKVYTLGQFDILVDDRPLEFTHKTPRKPLSLLKALISFGGREVSQEKLLDAIWPDEEGDAGVRAFEVSLHRLRKLLQRPDAVLLVGHSVSLNEKVIWTDVRAFERLTAPTRGGIDVRGAELPPEVEHAFALYRGSFLSGDVEEGWAVSQRERLRSRFVQFVSEVGCRLEGAGRWDPAVRWYLRGLETDDLTESFYQGLMRCYLAQKRNSEGMSVFRRMRQTLSVTLGIPPTPKSLELYRQLQAD